MSWYCKVNSSIIYAFEFKFNNSYLVFHWMLNNNICTCGLYPTNTMFVQSSNSDSSLCLFTHVLPSEVEPDRWDVKYFSLSLWHFAKVTKRSTWYPKALNARTCQRWCRWHMMRFKDFGGNSSKTPYFLRLVVHRVNFFSQIVNFYNNNAFITQTLDVK